MAKRGSMGVPAGASDHGLNAVAGHDCAFEIPILK